MVLKDIAMFHNRHRRQPIMKCCYDVNHIKLPIESLLPDMKEKHAATICTSCDDNSKDRFVTLCRWSRWRLIRKKCFFLLD